MAAKLPNVCWTEFNPLSILCGHERPVGWTFRVTAVCAIAVFFNSEELAVADGECHISCNTLPSHQNMNSLYFPSNHSTLLSSSASSWAFNTHTHTPVRTHTHTCTDTHHSLVFRWLWLLPHWWWKPPQILNPFSAGKKRDFFMLALPLALAHHVHPPTIKLWNHWGGGVEVGATLNQRCLS